MRRPAFVPVAAFVLLAAGCATPVAGTPDAPVASIVFPFLDDRFGDAADVLVDRLTEAGWDVEVHGTDGDIPAQVTTVAEALDAGVDALVVWPIDASSLTTVLDEADEGTFVVSFEVLVRDTAALDAHVEFSAAGEGVAQATALVDELGLSGGVTGPFRIELFAGSPENPRTERSFAAAMAVLEPYLEAGSLVVGSGESALEQVTTLRGTDDAARSRLTRILGEAYADGLPDAVLAPSDEIARGVAAALLDAGAVPGAGFPVVSGRGAQLRSLAALVDGRQLMTLLEDPRTLAELTADTLLSTEIGGYPVDNGATEVLARYLDPIPVRAEDIDDLIVGSGYWSRARVNEAIAEFGL